ncbi:imsC-like protein [Streptococcus suis]|uniref:DinB/UmuC family translesion DNA polymerase n=1 Tax=Streptococcus suis TaxID=1307 RepID=UPI000CF5CC94|nr:imsC-like protein [Streptococcus suis]NQK84423.1 imsC-like protein [Streptococcus suis]NQP63992.1 imsC-like protein [Streptococcus suis]HEM3624716.1 imsC-like protein [Streptococcus suis]HEM4119110.1 imsC-like protein [Streptococcus suis]HEM6172550.1 imsC-like protein [Streptococcus suis]
MKQEKNTVQFSEIHSKGCNDIEMLERFLHGIVETATSKLRQRKLKTTEISIRLVHAKSENRLPLEFTFSIKPTSSSVIIYTEVINRFKECYTGGGIQGFTIQFDKNTLASA